MPAASGGSSSTGLCDYFYTYFDTDDDIGWRVVLVGGFAINGVSAGGFFVYSADGFTFSFSSVGGRLCFRN
jgi:hypothetical protein